MKLPYFISRKMPGAFPKRKLRTATRKATAEAEDFEEEPNVKLSSAFIVVLILHLVAIGGYYAFISIQTHRPQIVDTPPAAPQTLAKSESSDHSGKPAIMPAANSSSAKIYRVKTGDTLTKIAAANGVSVEDLEEANGLKNVGALRVGQDLRLPGKHVSKPVSGDSAKAAEAKRTNDAAPKSSVAPSAAAKDSGQIYTIAKGDNPVGIAKKLRVPYDELLKLNKIEDPKKLQIGQKLKIPTKAK